MIRKSLPLLFSALVAGGLALLGSSCSSANLESMAETDSTSRTTVQTPVLDSLSDLPACDSAAKGLLYFVLQDSSFQYCNGKAYSIFDLGTAGEAGSSCSVATNKDNSKTITCTDGTSATVSDGTDGANGSAGANGDAGKTGNTGATGSSCTLSDDGHGTLTMTCGETSSSWAKALCVYTGMVAYKATATTSLTRMSVSLDDGQNSGIPYDPATEQCTMGSVRRACGSADGKIQWYYPFGSSSAERVPEFCDMRDSNVYEIAVMGEQAWMRQNLRYAGPDSSLGVKQETSGYSFDDEGRFYNWAEASADACPAGWELPGAAAVSALDLYLEELASAEDYDLARHAYLKSEDWYSSDSKGPVFHAIPNGQLQWMNASGTLSWIKNYASNQVFYWLSESIDEDGAKALIISNSNQRTVLVGSEAAARRAVAATAAVVDKSLYVAPQFKAYRNSVRCVRKTPATEWEIKFWENFATPK